LTVLFEPPRPGGGAQAFVGRLLVGGVQFDRSFTLGDVGARLASVAAPGSVTEGRANGSHWYGGLVDGRPVQFLSKGAPGSSGEPTDGVTIGVMTLRSLPPPVAPPATGLRRRPGVAL
jgi:hypothetical protein